jgi:D-sedoheptulose 7-phosphate isomerase
MDAGHLAAELLGRYAFDRPAPPAAGVADHTAAMTAIGNDYGFDDVFARQVIGLGADGDVLVGLTDTQRVQEACLHLGHTICELVEAAMFQQSLAPSPARRQRC